MITFSKIHYICNMVWIIVSLFFIGYFFIIIEKGIKLDKAATALITGVLCWVVYSFLEKNPNAINHQLLELLSEIAGILFFLIGAMTIVELIDLYDGFQIIVDRIKTNSKRKLLIIITILSFCISSILDNLTTAIVMTSLISKLLADKQDRMIMIGMIIIASNAGGAWSPIGDVTTTMLWIGNQITTESLLTTISIPSIVATVVPLLFLIFKLKGNYIPILMIKNKNVNDIERNTIFFSGLGLLVFVPIFKLYTHLPPFMGMMLAVGILWLVSEILHRKKGKANEQNSIFSALERIDMPSILFFFGILLAVGSLQASGILTSSAHFLSSTIKNDLAIVFNLGLFSAIFDNVPLVAAVQGMYHLDQYPSGDFFWNFLAFCSGTGGSIFIIGSAAGVAAMGIEQISFFWYVRNISLAALLGYIAGAATCLLLG